MGEEETKKQETDREYKGTLTEVTAKLHASQDSLKLSRSTLDLAKDRIIMLEQGMELKSTTTQKIHKLDADSLEIGNQATGRIKVYGDFSNKARFSAKLKDAFDVLAGAMQKKSELDGNGGSEKK